MFDFAGTQLDDASTLGSVVWKDYSVVRDEGDEYAAPSAGDIFLDEPSLKQLTCRTRGMRRGGGNGVCVTISASYSMLQSRVKSFHHTNVLVRLVHAIGSCTRELHNTVAHLNFNTRYLNHHGSN
jgi:hypothetical protein